MRRSAESQVAGEGPVAPQFNVDGPRPAQLLLEVAGPIHRGEAAGEDLRDIDPAPPAGAVKQGQEQIIRVMRSKAPNVLQRGDAVGVMTPRDDGIPHGVRGHLHGGIIPIGFFGAPRAIKLAR